MIRLIALQLVLAQTPPASPPLDERAAQAAEKAADAAERAADAAAKAAASAAQVAESVKVPAPLPPAPCPAPPAPVKPSPWTATVGLGLISLTGNTSSVTVNGTAAAERKSDEWIFGLKAAGTYGQSRATDTSVSGVVAEMAGIQARIDRRFTDKVAAYVLGGIDTDHVKSVEYQAWGEAGVSLIWLDSKKDDGSQTFLRTDLGGRYQKEARFQYFPVPLDIPDVTLVGPRLAGEFRYGLTKDLLFVQTAEVMTNIGGDTQTLVNTLSKVSVRVVGNLAVGASFAINYDSAPAVGKVPTDTALAFNLDYAL